MRRSFLGDTYSEGGSDGSSEFETPERNTNDTSYNLRYSETSQPSRISQNIQPTARKSTARINTGRRTTVTRNSTVSNGNEIPSTSREAGQSQQPAAPSQERSRKQKNPTSWDARNKKFQKEYNKLITTTDNLIPKLPFGRLVREIIYENNCQINRITRVALEALQEATEYYLTQMFTDANMLTLHRGRVTLSIKDMKLLLLLVSTRGHN